jgi:hypothetical protein
MPYVAPGLPPSSSIPKSLAAVSDKTPHAKTGTDEYSQDVERTPLEPSNTDPSTPRAVSQSADDSTMTLATNPASGLLESFASLDVNAPPQSPSAPSSSLPAASSPSLRPQNDGQVMAGLEENLDPDASRRGSTMSSKTTSSLPALDPHSASSSSLASSLDESCQVSTPGTTTGLTSPSAVAVAGDRESGIARYREGLYAYTVSFSL